MVDLRQAQAMVVVVEQARQAETEQVVEAGLVAQAYLHLLLESLLYMVVEVVAVRWVALQGQEGQVVVEQALLIKRLRPQAQLTPVAVAVAVDII
jgi:hypothetical protein